jgi:phenylpropionate dioxygenase-like ring-hydroxylating dioxygenase large terminal subunit
MFLRNHWYVAASASEIGRTPLGRIILGEPSYILSHRNRPLCCI